MGFMRLLIRRFVCLLTTSCVLTANAENLDSVLNVLDASLAKREKYLAIYKRKIETAERKALDAERRGDARAAYTAWDGLSRLAFPRDGERALLACRKAAAAAERLGDVGGVARHQERRALAYGLCGLPWEGKALLDSLSASARLRPYLTRTIHTAYYDLYDFFHAYALPEDLLNRNYAYLATLEDSIKKYTTDPTALAMTFHYSTRGADAMIAPLKEAFGRADDEEKGLIATTISNKYFLKRDIPQRDYYWAVAAVYNVRTARRDNEALTRLAARMFELGDVERGRRYALCAYDDAVAYHSRSRMLEVAPLLAASSSSLAARVGEMQAQLRGWQAAAGGLSLGLAALAGMLWRMRRRARTAAARLTEENAALRRECEKARRDAQVRGEYVSRFLDLSLDETYRLEQQKSTVLLKLQAGDTERLKKLMRDPEFPDHFRGHCLHRFDIAFQRLYPGFAEAVNRLLLPEERIELPENEVLNNDLRVLAFMCLGITDSQKIAAILGVSVNTVYFYRNKLRRKALRCETFEREVVDIVAAAVPTTRPV